jgi:hypothetical protein
LGATPSTASFVGKLSDSGRYLQGLHFASASRWCKRRMPASIGVDGEKTVIRVRGVKAHARAVREVLEAAVLAGCGE